MVLTFAGSVPLAKCDEIANTRISHIEEFLQPLLSENSFTSSNKRRNLETNTNFQVFQDYWLTDNVIHNWTLDGVSTLSLLTA